MFLAGTGSHGSLFLVHSSEKHLTHCCYYCGIIKEERIQLQYNSISYIIYLTDSFTTRLAGVRCKIPMVCVCLMGGE